MEAPPPDRTGQVLAQRYRITGVLGAGAMADVYEALDLHSNISVAVKLLNEDVKDRSAYHDRFEREALITAKFRHPTCIRILDFGNTDEGLPFQVMEVVRGRQLADILDAEERLPPARALNIFKQLLYALVECGNAGVIHRDIKPENLLIYGNQGQSDCVKLIDFGIAKLIGDAAVGHEKLTSVGLILGTPHYIAPEWVTSDDVDCRADLYSATILLFEMLTSAPPFLSEDRKALMKMHLSEEPPTLRDRIPGENFSDELEAMVRKGLAKEPSERFADAREYLQALSGLGVDELVVPQPLAPQPHLQPAGIPGVPNQQGFAPAPPRAKSPLVFAGIALVVLGALIALAFVDRGAQPEPLDGARDSGAEKAAVDASSPAPAAKDVDAGATKDSSEPAVPVAPMTETQIADLRKTFTDAGLKTSGFDGKGSSELASGHCRYGRVEELRVLLCLAAADPIATSKAVSRKAPGEDEPRKWRARIKSGEYHLRDQSEGRNKKRKKMRRKIESAFKKR